MTSGAASSRATTALGLGLLSLLVGFPAGIPAAILGRLEMHAIDEGHAPEAGRVRATAAMILGVVSTVASCLCCGIYGTGALLTLR